MSYEAKNIYQLLIYRKTLLTFVLKYHYGICVEKKLKEARVDIEGSA